MQNKNAAINAATTRVLLIDDDEDTAVIIEDALDEARRGNYELITCTHPRHAFEVIEMNRADVCLLDYHFNGLDGLAFLKQLRNAGSRCR